MQNPLTILLFFLAFGNIYSQQPQLVRDLNEGPDPSFSEWNYAAAYLAEDIILPISSKNIGEEPAIITNGELLILKDIYEGPESSSPQGFIEYKGFLYFSAKDADNDFALWKTDGTLEGTVLDFDPGKESQAMPSAFTIAANGWLYYGYADKIFRTNGSVHEEIVSGVVMERVRSRASNNYCAYKNGILCLNKNKDDSFSLLYIDDEATELCKTEDTGFFGIGFGVAPVSNGVMFSINQMDLKAIYIYNDTDSSLTTLPIGGEFSSSERTINISEEKNICWIPNKGIYTINGLESEEELIFQSTNLALTQDRDLISAKFEGRVAMVIEQGIGDSDYLFYTDGTANGSETLLELKPKSSHMILHNNFGYFADGASNGFEPTIYEVDLATGTLDTVHIFTANSNKINSIRPVGVQDGSFYYIGSLDETVGAELYRINLNDVISSASQVERLDLNLIQNRNTLEIQMEETKEMDISVFDTSGKTIFSGKKFSNRPFALDVISGPYFIRVVADNQMHSQLITIFN